MNIAYIEYFRSLAKANQDIAHEQGSGKNVRNSFFDGEADLSISTTLRVDYPCMVLPKYSGKLSGDFLQVSDLMTGSFEIRQHVTNPADLKARTEAEDRCKRIAFDFIAYMLRQVEETGSCGPITNFDINSVRYDFPGLVGNSDVGCSVSFQFEEDAFNPLTIDLDSKFIF